MIWPSSRRSTDRIAVMHRRRDRRAGSRRGICCIICAIPTPRRCSPPRVESAQPKRGGARAPRRRRRCARSRAGGARHRARISRADGVRCGMRAPPLRAVDGVSLTVHPGETVGLVGESGSGKSSLLRAILALDRPAGGRGALARRRILDRRPARGCARLRRTIQAVFQDPYGSFDPRWPVERLIAEPFFSAAIRRRSPPSAGARSPRRWNRSACRRPMRGAIRMNSPAASGSASPLHAR